MCVQVHKGNLSALKENQKEIKIDQTRQQKSIAIATPKGYSKVQAIIQEKDSKIEKFAEEIEESKKPEKSEKVEKQEKPEKPEKPEKIDKCEKEDEKVKLQNGAHAMPPKPLPRASRTNSLSEEEPKPVARPRTTPSPGAVVTSVNPNVVGGYKVGLKIELIL